MNKKIFTIGYEIPGNSEMLIDFSSGMSLMDADVLLISPDSLYPTGNWVRFTTSDSGCYNVSASKSYKEKMSHLKKEMLDHLNSGKNIFLLLSKEEEYLLANGVSTGRKNEHTYHTETYSNYNFLPISIGTRTSASGNHIEFSGNNIMANFYKEFSKNLKYLLYVEEPNNAQIIFTGKDKTKILGAIHKAGNGNLVTLPYITYNEKEFYKYDEKKKKELWTDKGIKFGHKLINCLLNMDQQLNSDSQKTPTPEWAKKEEFSTTTALSISKEIEKNEKEIEKIKLKNLKLNKKLAEENSLKDLLFEQSKPLEIAVINALEILGYQAENYDDGELEMDQVIVSPEKIRFIGECEGKDTKDINITKFRQLVDALNADFAREDIEERALGILFGNPERLTEPEKRKLDFTKKCQSAADREKIALVKTADLFSVIKYLKENKDSKFQKECRDAIFNGLGSIVKFPDIPKK